MPRGAATRSAGTIPSDGTLAWGTTLAFALTFLFRWLTVDFPNDHFTHLSRARQILMGEWPLRDFFDPGQILHYYLSAAAQLMFGYNLYGEALLTIGFIAIAAALTFRLSATLSQSPTIGACTALVTVAALPRLYNYPKVFLYIAALALGWRYAQRPSRRGSVMLAIFTVVAFLFRYDHGVFIAGFVLLLLTFLHIHQPRQWIASVASYLGLLSLVLVLPALMYVQLTSGLQSFVRTSQASVHLVGWRLRLTWPRLVIDRSMPLLVVHPFAERRLTIRWKDSIDDSARRELERGYGLIDSMAARDKNSWNYGLIDGRAEHVNELGNDAAVDGVSGVRADDLAPSTIRSIWQVVDRHVPFFRISVAPGVFTVSNALAFFYYLTVCVPAVALLIGVGAWWRGAVARPEAATIVAASCLCLIINWVLIADTPATRLADVVTPSAVLGAWIAGRLLARRPDRNIHTGWSAPARVLVVTVFGVMLWSVVTQAGTIETLRDSRLPNGPGATLRQAAAVYRQLHQRPIDAWAPDDKGTSGIQALGRYVWRCTTPADRLLVTGAFEPEIFFYAERPFAGGQVHFLMHWHDSTADQQLTIERIRRQSVPIVIAGVEGDEGFRTWFPDVANYIDQRYVEAARSTFNGEHLWRVLVDPSRTPAGTDARLGLPCYR